MNDTEPATKVTLGTIYSTLLEVKSNTDPLPKQVSDHEVRIRAIEKYLWIWIGSAGAVGAGASQVVSEFLIK